MYTLTPQESINVELWRVVPPNNLTKNICQNLFNIKNKIIVSLGNKKEKRNCFCSAADRKAYRDEFFIYYDNITRPPVENI